MYGKTCNYCGDVGLEVDHVIELAAGGENSIENLQVLCKNCHKIKTSKFNSSRFKGTRSVFSNTGTITFNRGNTHTGQQGRSRKWTWIRRRLFTGFPSPDYKAQT
jgi:hypothetical protein